MDPIIKIHSDRYIYLIIVVAAIGSFSLGNLASWTSPETAKLETDDNPLNRKLTKDEISWLGSIASLACIGSPFLYTFLMNTVGRKMSLMISTIPGIACSVIISFAADLNWWYFARFISGISMSAIFFVTPVYIAEVSQPANRGFLATVVICSVQIGMLFSLCVGPYVSFQMFNIIIIAPGLLYLVACLLFLPETPMFYILKKDYKRAEEMLKIIRGTNFVQQDMDEMHNHLQMEKGGFVEIFKTRPGRRAFVICLILELTTAFSGVGPILTYTQMIFDEADSVIDSALAAIIQTIVQIIAISLLSGIVDKFGRRIMILISTTGIIFGQLSFATYSYFKDSGTDMSNLTWMPLVCMLVLLVSLSIGLAPLKGIIIGELFPLNVKAQGTGIVISIGFCITFLATYFYSDMTNVMGTAGTFYMYAAGLALINIFFFFGLIETKGKTLSEIQRELEN